MSNQPISPEDQQYYYLDDDQYNALKQYDEGRFIVDDFIYVSSQPGHSGLWFAKATSINADELDFLYENDAVQFLWFRWSNQPSIMQ